MAAPDPRPRRARRGPRLTRVQRIALGLLLTLVGVFLLSILLPSDPSRQAEVLPIAAAGILGLWVGGVLMGVGSRS